MLRIRPATPADAPCISQVHALSWKSTYPGIVPASYLEQLSPESLLPRWVRAIETGATILVAEHDGAIAGFASGGKIREDFQDYTGELYAIYLLHQVQRQGIGTTLLRQIALGLKENHISDMLAWVLENNFSTHFYKSSGAVLLDRKTIEIGGAALPALAYGWPDLSSLIP